MEYNIKINKHAIANDNAPYVIAEIGSNHNGDMQLCQRIIDAAVDCGADAVKFQSWSKNSLISKAEYQRNTSYADKKKHFGSLEEMVTKYAFTPQQHLEIAQYCKQQNIEFLSSAFSPGEVDMLESLEVPLHKVASMDINHFPLLTSIAETKKPVLLSTGMASMAEIAAAVEILDKNNSGPIVLLHCISIYPPEFNTINLNNIPMLEKAFGLPVGFSDHSIGTNIPLAAIALGACVIEKHFTLNKELDGWDHAISADAAELKAIVMQGGQIKEALGESKRVVSAEEIEKRTKFRRRIVINKSLNAGSVLRLDDIDFKRPGNGINPNEYQYVVGRSLKEDVGEDHELSWDDLV